MFPMPSQIVESSSVHSKVHHDGGGRTGAAHSPLTSTVAINKNGNHRVRVTVQRRANNKEKVVSLSFDHDTQPNIDNGLTLKSKPTCELDNVGHNNASQIQQVSPSCKIPVLAEIDEPRVPTFNDENISDNSDFPDPQSVDVLEECDVLRSVVSPRENATDCGAPASEDELARPNLAPPPIRLRQAWASPVTQTKSQHGNARNEKKNSGTNTGFSHRKKTKQVETVAKGFTSKTCENVTEPSVLKSRLALNSNKHKDEQNPTTDVSKCSKDSDALKKQTNGELENECPKSENTVTASVNKSNVSIKSSYSSATVVDTNKSISPNDAKPPCEGDTSEGKEPVCMKEDNPPIDSNPSSRNNEISTEKSHKNKKKTSLFSWRPFKRKTCSKTKQTTKGDCDNKNSESTLEQPAQKIDVTKPTMADILCTNSAVALPQSLTDMFAAKTDNKCNVKDECKK